MERTDVTLLHGIQDTGEWVEALLEQFGSGSGNGHDWAGSGYLHYS
jgi:hypothetical protein